MDLDFGELEVKGIHRDNNDFKVYYLQWSIRDYPRLKPNKKYKAHHIVLGSKVLKIIVSRQEQSNILIIKVVPYPKFSTISFTMVSPDGTEYDAFFKDTIRDIQYSSFYVSSTDLVTVRMEVTTSSVLSLFKSVDAPTNLSSQLGTLLSSGQHSDAQVAAGGVTIPVHRGILAARCPLLDGKMIIDNADKESVQELLNYLYTGRTKDLHQDLAYSLFQLSHQYRLSGLVEQVAVYLERNMNPQDVLRTLVLADVYGHQGLRKRAIDFVVRHTNAVMYREDWGPFSLNHPVILNEILQGVSEYCLQSKITVQGTAYKEDEDPTA